MLCLLKKDAPTRRQEAKKSCLPCVAQGLGMGTSVPTAHGAGQFYLDFTGKDAISTFWKAL